MTPETEFDKDAGDCLAAMMEGSAIGHLVAPAAVLAGQQLELLSPVVLGTGGLKDLLYGGKVVQVAPRTVLFVVADDSRGFTMHLSLLDGYSAADLVTYAIAELETAFADLLGQEKDAAKGVPTVLNHVLEKFGAPPGERGARTMDDPERARALVGLVLRALPPERRASMAQIIDACLEASICPAWVCLIGPASSGKPDTYSFGSLMLPVAPFMEDLINQIEATEPDCCDHSERNGGASVLHAPRLRIAEKV